jgi:hypothetical protein
MARFLFAWELGANLGHLTRLAPVARDLKARGHEVVFALRDVSAVHQALDRGLGRTLQAPVFLHAPPSPSWSMADVLLTCGYGSAGALGGLVDAWCGLFELSACDALIADHAPTALLAARVVGVPALHLGHGFTVPPRESPMRVFRDWSAVPEGHAAQSDARALANVNAVLQTRGAAPLAQLWQLFHPERTLLCTWPELDHYGARGAVDPYLGPDCEFLSGAAPAWPPGTGPRVFAYLRPQDPQHIPLLQALAALGHPTICFLPGMGSITHALPRASNIHYSDRPLDLQQTLPQGCRLVVCHAGQATVSQSLLHGIPCLLLPMHAEQFLMARRAEGTGAAINAASQPRPTNHAALVSQLLQDGGPHQQAARAFAHKYREFDASQLSANVVAACESLLGAR